MDQPGLTRNEWSIDVSLDEHFNEESINEAVAKFMTLFHTCIPDLYSYFEEEEVDIKEWAASALQFVLSRELPLENTMRLWDTYFSIPDAGWMDLHPYACLAILKHLKDGFEDLEQSEIRTMLMRLPQMDMDRVRKLILPPPPRHPHNSFCPSLKVKGHTVPLSHLPIRLTFTPCDMWFVFFRSSTKHSIFGMRSWRGRYQTAVFESPSRYADKHSIIARSSLTTPSTKHYEFVVKALLSSLMRSNVD